MKLYRKISGLCAALVVVMCGGAAVSGAVDPVTREVFDAPAAGIGSVGFVEAGGRLFRYEDGVVAPYSGIMSVEGKRYCYNEGCKWFGWKKIDGKWYYFDAADGGALGSEKVETALGVYYIDESGAWDGRYTAKAKAPEDFAFFYGVYEYGSSYSLQSDTGELIIDLSWDEGQGASGGKVKVPVKDRQIIYDTLMSCGGDKLTKPLTGEALIGGIQNTDQGRFEVRFTAEGKNYDISGDRGMYQLYGKNEQVTSCAYITAFLDDYIKTFPEWEDEAAMAAGGELLPMVTEINKFNGVEMRLYKYPVQEMPELAGQTDVVISTWEQAQGYAALLEEAYGEGCSAAAGVRSCGEEFFRENVLYMNTVYTAEGEHRFKFTGAQVETAEDMSVIVLSCGDRVSEGTQSAAYVFSAKIPRERFEGCSGVKMNIGI